MKVPFTLHPRLLVASRVNQIVPRSAHGCAAGRSLVAPLTPALFRGQPMNREGRRRAGFSEEFLDALEAFEAQR